MRILGWAKKGWDALTKRQHIHQEVHAAPEAKDLIKLMDWSAERGAREAELRQRVESLQEAIERISGGADGLLNAVQEGDAELARELTAGLMPAIELFALWERLRDSVSIIRSVREGAGRDRPVRPSNNAETVEWFLNLDPDPLFWDEMLTGGKAPSFRPGDLFDFVQSLPLRDIAPSDSKPADGLSPERLKDMRIFVQGVFATADLAVLDHGVAWQSDGTGSFPYTWMPRRRRVAARARS